MDRLNPAILEAFGAQRIIKKVKGYYICETQGGFAKLHISSDPTHTINLQHAIKEHLAAEGFPFTDRYHLTKAGQPFLLMGRDNYVMTMYPQPQHETDFSCEDEVLQMVKALALFHNAARNLALATAPVHLAATYTHMQSELAQATKQARRTPRLSDFDVAFIKHMQYYNEIIEQCISSLTTTSYARLLSEATAAGHLCHNAIKEENMPLTSEGVHIINFSQAANDLQLNDLAAFIRRYAQRSNKAIPISRILEAYDHISPLPHGAVEILHTMLNFPWAFMKIVTQYYSKKRNWTPNGLLNRMDAILAERESYEQYVSELQF